MTTFKSETNLTNFLRKILCLMLHLRRYIVLIGTPLFLLPLLISGGKISVCAYALMLMIAYWIFEALPIFVTGLIPLLLFPITGLMSSENTCKAYMSETAMVFLGSTMCAIAFEESNLHKRIALKVLLLIGFSSKRLLLGFMIPTALIGMWMGGAPTTVLMLPLVDAILMQLESYETKSKKTASPETSLSVSLVCTTLQDTETSTTQKHKNSSELDPIVRRKAFYMAVAFISSAAGNGTLTGSVPSLLLRETLERAYPNFNGLTFAAWLEFSFPVVVVCTTFIWIILVLIFFRRNEDTDQNQRTLVKKSVKQKYKQLGKIKFQELAVILCFTFMVMLWFFRDPEFLSGWGRRLGFSVAKQDKNPATFIKDSSAAFLVVVLLFILPSDPKRLQECSSILEWRSVQQKVPWGILIMMGGSIALAEGVKTSGLSAEMGQYLARLGSLSFVPVTLIVCLVTLALTEVSSNTATASILMPVVVKMASEMRVHPLSLLVPVSMCCNFSFMLPIATPPNTIIAELGKISSAEMAWPGICVKVACLLMLMVSIFSFGVPIFKLNDNFYSDTSLNSTMSNTSGLYFESL